MFRRLLSCFLAEFFPFRSSRVLMSLLLKAVGLRELWRKFPHSSPLVFPRLWYLGLYGLKIPILLDTRAPLRSELLLSFWSLGTCGFYLFLVSQSTDCSLLQWATVPSLYWKMARPIILGLWVQETKSCLSALMVTSSREATGASAKRTTLGHLPYPYAEVVSTD